MGNQPIYSQVQIGYYTILLHLIVANLAAGSNCDLKLKLYKTVSPWMRWENYE